MRVLITGGCGFIGSNLIARLSDIRPDVDIRVFDNESLGRRGHLGRFTGEFVRGDMRDRPALAAALAGIDAVVHLAADTRVMDSIAAPEHNFAVNVVGTFNLLEAMRATGVRRLVNASTGGAILGEVSPPVHEEMTPRPLAPYGAGKLAVEGYCSAYAASFGFSAVSLRFSNVYGPRSHHKGSVVAAFLKRIAAAERLVVHGDGEQTRDFVFVDDLCDGIVAAFDRETSGVIQLGSGRPVTINALLDVMRQVTAPLRFDVEYAPFRDGEIVHTWCSIDRAAKVLGYAPRTSLEDGLDRTWRWFRQHRAQAA